ncbi:MAG: hypothetical protein QOF76_2337 [Solirubrobacteraceae bacterium]|jgi:glycosyltransferase involved in cell wall biosynthesis|nr:hypothetical protein [Solirubrobacteraceae bacterium]
MGRTRVVILVDCLDDATSGGAERVAVTQAVHLPKDVYDVTVCSSRSGSGQLVADIEASAAEHVSLHRTSRRDLAGYRRLYALLRERRPDVLHAHMHGSNVNGSLIGTLARVPVVISHEHTWSYEGEPLRKLLDGLVVGRLSDAFLAVSTADADRMRRLEHVPARKVRVLPNAWVPRAPSPARDIRAAAGIPSDAPLAAAITVLRPQKRLEVLVEAFSHTLRAVPDARLVIAGEGPERGTIEAAIVRFGVAGSVHLLGFCQDVDNVWAAADVLAMSSDFEGMPLAVLEGMAAGLPVVATDVGALPDITDAGCAILVGRRDPAALGAALAEMLGDAGRRAAMSAAAKEKAADYTVERFIERTRALYDDLLSRSRRCPRRGRGGSP